MIFLALYMGIGIGFAIVHLRMGGTLAQSLWLIPFWIVVVWLFLED